MRVAFTGHRDKSSDPVELASMVQELGATLVIHGGAQGFDSQVAEVLSELPSEVLLPDYNSFGRSAPLVRNKQILELADCLVACWDGRRSGGTFYTINLARKMGLPVRILSPR